MNKKAIDNLLLADWYRGISDKSLLPEKPWDRYITHKIWVRLVNDTVFPNENVSKEYTWYRSYLHDITDEGIELNDTAYTNIWIAVNKASGKFRYIDYGEKPKSDEIAVKCDRLTLIPFDEIVSIDTEGDEYPTIFCKFKGIGFSPVHKVYLRVQNTDICIVEQNILQKRA